MHFDHFPSQSETIEVPAISTYFHFQLDAGNFHSQMFCQHTGDVVLCSLKTWFLFRKSDVKSGAVIFAHKHLAAESTR